MTPDNATLEAVLAAVAEEVGASTEFTGGGADFSRSRRKFAFVAGDIAEFRLDPDIAEAALRTPDTTASPRGAEWVRLAPADPKPMDLDRARAWFLSAWRNAER